MDWTPGEKAYIDLYIATSTTTNNYFWYTVGNAKSYTSWTENPTLNGTAYEFTTVNGCKSDLGFTGNIAGNATSATKLQTARTIWGQSFDGTGNVSGGMSQVTFIELSGNSSNSGHGGFIDFHYNGSTSDYTSRIIEDASGRLALNYCIYVTSGNVGIGTASPSTKLHVNGSLRASSLTLDGTNLLEWDESNSAWKFNGNLIATGFIASGDISAQAAALAEEEDRIAALEAQVAELQAEIENLKAS